MEEKCLFLQNIMKNMKSFRSEITIDKNSVLLWKWCAFNNKKSNNKITINNNGNNRNNNKIFFIDIMMNIIYT